MVLSIIEAAKLLVRRSSYTSLKDESITGQSGPTMIGSAGIPELAPTGTRSVSAFYSDGRPPSFSKQVNILSDQIAKELIAAGAKCLFDNDNYIIIKN